MLDSASSDNANIEEGEISNNSDDGCDIQSDIVMN